jgi:hypothetical protein
MRRLRSIALVMVAVTGFAASPALAADDVARSSWRPCNGESVHARPWAVDWSRIAADNSMPAVAPMLTPLIFDVATIAEQTPQPRRRPIAFEYSEGYKIRAKIHKIASVATLPLFIAEYLVGQNLYTHPENATGGKRGAHAALAASTGVVFGINSITGGWNLIEARKDPNHRTKRTIHGILMLVADLGFAVTGATAPESEHERVGGQNEGGSRSTHRAIAITSMGIAAVSYLMMLIGR